MDIRGCSAIPRTPHSPHMDSPVSRTFIPSELFILDQNHEFPTCTGYTCQFLKQILNIDTGMFGDSNDITLASGELARFENITPSESLILGQNHEFPMYAG